MKNLFFFRFAKDIITCRTWSRSRETLCYCFQVPILMGHRTSWFSYQLPSQQVVKREGKFQIKGNPIPLSLRSRARPDWAYEFPDRTGPDTLICRTSPAGPDWIRTYIFKHFTYQLQVITSHKIRSLNTNLVSKIPRPNK